MICNERQFKITSKQLKKLKEHLESYLGTDEPAWLANAHKAALQSQISELEAELSEYELIERGEVDYYKNSDLSSLPKALIAARIARSMSQKDLAESLQMTTQQVQRYEATNYMGASLARLIEIARILNVRIQERWGKEPDKGGDVVYSWDDSSKVDWKQFPITEMLRRGWLEIKHKQSPVDAIKEFFTKSAGPEYATAFHRKKFHGSNRPNEYSLLAWQGRVLEKARKEVKSNRIGKFTLNDSWVHDLARTTREENGPLIARSMLAEHGVILVTEGHLEGTYLDGAAMRLDTGHAVVAITLRHDRLDNFWFVLMHELGHVYLHLFDSLHMDFFDEESAEESDHIERNADNYALENLIPKDEWDLCLSRFSMTKEAVLLDAARLGVHPSIVAGRIRKERSRYTILNDLVGQGEVRQLFGDTQ